MEKVKLFNLLTFSNNVQSILNLWNEMKLTEPLYHTGLNLTEADNQKRLAPHHRNSINRCT